MSRAGSGFVTCLLALSAVCAAADEVAVRAAPAKVEYRSFQNETLQRHAWMGKHVAFLTVRADLDPAVMEKLCRTFDAVREFYREAAGREPNKAKLHEGRTTVAEVEKTCGAGCGYLGATGIELMPGCFRELYEGVAKHDEYDQALPYEFGRNYWFYGPQLEYHKDAQAGVIPTGYAVFMRFLALDAAGAKLGTFRGKSGAEFRREVERLVELYEADKTLSWENTLKVGAAPNNPMGLGATDLFASFCMRLCRQHGGAEFAAKLWQAAGKRPAAKSTQEAIDNFVLAASEAAGKDLTSQFAKAWRWPVSKAACDEAAKRFPSVANETSAAGR